MGVIFTDDRSELCSEIEKLVEDGQELVNRLFLNFTA